MNTTDREILQQIYDNNYYRFIENNSNYFLEINLKEVANYLNMDYGELWGRLFYHLDPKYSIKDDKKENTWKVKFMDVTDKEEFVKIHFPLLCGILADLKQEHFSSITLPVISLIVSIIAITIGVIK